MLRLQLVADGYMHVLTDLNCGDTFHYQKLLVPIGWCTVAVVLALCVRSIGNSRLGVLIPPSVSITIHV